MPERGYGAGHLRQVAITALDAHLHEQEDAQVLSDVELRGFANHDFTHGWLLLAEDLSGHKVRFQIMIDIGFPYSMPRVGFASGPKALEWPHVERHELLCLLPTNTVASPNNPVGVAKEILAIARQFVRDHDTESTDREFRREFQSYWRLATTEGAPVFRSLVDSKGPSRKISVYRKGKSPYVADDAATLEGWLSNAGVKNVDRPKFESGVLIWLPELLIPDGFPKTGADVYKLAQEAGGRAAEILEELAMKGGDSIPILLGAQAETGVCFAGLLLNRPKVVRRNRDHSKDGFRPDRYPPHLLRKQYLGPGGKVARCMVSRVDHNWIHGRDHDPTQSVLQKARVLVLGCGSIGGGVARSLAQSGVGHLTLVDKQRLDWPNIGRHVLGAASVYSNKAEELARVMRRDFPHLSFIEHRTVDFNLGSTSLVAEFGSFDLIVAVTGEWSVDALLCDLQSEYANFPPIVYGWMEPHASVGHAVLFETSKGPACLRCGFSDSGRFSRPVIKWSEDIEVFQEPECGAVFSPYGPIDQAWSQTLISDLAVDTLVGRANPNDYRIWIGKKDRVEQMGGAWDGQWILAHEDPEYGERVVRTDWARSTTCHICHGAQVA